MSTATRLPALGTTSTCRHCRREIVYTVVQESGHEDRLGWSDGFYRDALVCFSARDLTHVPQEVTP